MNCYIGLDMGTSAVKGVLLSQSGEILATCTGQFEYFTESGGKLMDPSRFLETCFDVIEKLAAHPCAEVVAICPSCASGNLILLDEDYAPLTPIIGWQSKLEQAEFDTYFTDDEKKEIYRTVGWPALNSFPLAYLMWIRNHRTELLKKAGMICMSAEYLNYALTGKFGISHSMATPFYLADQEKGVYNGKLLEKLGIEENVLPPIWNKGHVLGEVREDTGKKLGLSGKTKVVLGTFDHPSGALGAGVFEKGEMLLSCGTSWVAFFPAENRETAISTGALTDRFMLSGSAYCVMRSVASISEKIAAYRAHFFGDISFAEFDALAEKAALGCKGLRFDFSGKDYGNADGYAKADVARAIIESAARLLAAHISEMESKGFAAEKITIIGGITNSPVCVRIIAQNIGKDLRVVNGVSAGAVGAAMLAGIGIGDFADEKACFRAMDFAETQYQK